MAETCNEIFRMADDQGDNYATMTCQLQQGHKGLHCEQYHNRGIVIVLWETSSTKTEE